jgi:transcription antitermination factor NusG
MRALLETAALSSALLEAQPRWYACYTRARHEKLVERQLRERAVESYLPTIRMLRQWKDRKKLINVVLFPSYVFARFPLGQLYTVLAVPGITTVVRSNGHPVVVPDDDLANVRRFAEVLSAVDGEATVRAFPARGDHVCITSGPFCGIRGVVLEHRKRCRVLVGLQAIGWGAEVELDAELLEVCRA